MAGVAPHDHRHRQGDGRAERTRGEAGRSARRAGTTVAGKRKWRWPAGAGLGARIATGPPPGPSHGRTASGYPRSSSAA